MAKNLRWRVLLILVVILGSVALFYPPATKVRLGLDLKGGVHLVLQVHTDDALRLETETTSERVRENLSKAGASATVAVAGPTEFRVDGVPPGQDAAVRQVGSEIEGTFNRSSGAGSYTFTMKPNIAVQLRDEAVTQALQTIERRVNELGVAEPVVAKHGGGDQLLVQLPGVTDVNRAKEIIRSTAMLELKLVEKGPAGTREQLIQESGGAIPSDMEILPGVADSSGGGTPTTVFYMVRKVPAVTGRDLRNARPTLDETNRPAVSFSFNQEGARKFAAFTGANIGRQLGVVLDKRVMTAPTIQDRISDEGRIHGNFNQQEANDLSLVLKSGALPASLTYLEERTIGPTLGADSVREGVTAAIGGLILVVLFMLFYYRLTGLNALVSIVCNLLILLGLMAYLGATMTLPGIAGLILTIGVGVDSNVLIFERIKEELLAGKSVKQSVAAGFDRVWWTIVDTHVASLISAAFLFNFGTGPIRGFATTLTIGLLANVFTAVFVSRTIFEIELSARRSQTLSI